MKVCLGEGFMFRNLPFEKAVREIKKVGYDYLELLWGTRVGPDTKDGHVRDLKSILDQNGVKVLSLMGGSALASLDIATRLDAVATFLRQITIAQALDCKTITREMSGGNATRQVECITAFRASMEQVCPALEKNDISASFEPLPGDFIEESNLGVDVLREINSKNVGYLYCCPHTFVLGGEGSDISSAKTAEDMIAYAGKLVNFVHVADSHKMVRIVVSFAPKGFASMRNIPEYKGMKTHEHLIPGHGEVDFKSVFRGLKKIQYDGTVSCIPFVTDNPVKAAKESLRVVKKYISAS
jgi:myo-inositol catabolism protein IolH